jgi:anaerobic selenocysteine-containing dehydrogenase
VIVGNNPVVSHQTYPFAAGQSGAPGRSFAEARRRGTRIIVVDPRRTETARYADLLIQPMPGEDAALFAGIAHILLRDGTYNKEFCHRFATQLDALREAVSAFTPDYVAARADVPVAQIEQAAEWLGQARKPFVGGATGPSMSAHSNLNDHMIETVNALVGGYNRAGDLVRNPGSFKPRVFKETVIPARRTWETGVKCRTADIGQIFGEFPTALLPREILTPGPDKIRALIVLAGNPAMALGDPEKTIAAFKDLELLVVLDARMNETAKLAHYVIATSQPFERHDLTIPGDSQYPEPFAQYAPPVISRPAATIDDWEFFWEVAARMHVPLTFKYLTYGMRFDAIPNGLQLDMTRRPDPEVLIRYLCEQGAVSFDELKANPSGVRLQRPPQYVQSVEDNGARLELCPPDVAADLSALLAEQPDRRYRYRLTSRRILEAMNSAFRDAARTRKRYPVNWAYMSPEDMMAEGVHGDALIEIESEFGQILGVPKPDPGLRRGVLSMTHLYGSLEPSIDPLNQRGSHTGRLTSLERYLEPINYMPRFSGIPINVRVAGSQINGSSASA